MRASPRFWGTACAREGNILGVRSNVRRSRSVSASVLVREKMLACARVCVAMRPRFCACAP
eukprot:5559713-Pleurochrysis_carterae.AAC.1